MLGELQDLGVELVAVSGDPRERAEAFVSYRHPKFASSAPRCAEQDTSLWG